MSLEKKKKVEKFTNSLDFFRESIEKIQKSSNNLSVSPNVFLQTLLFRPIAKDSDRVFSEKYKEVCGFANENYELMVYKRGEDLDQGDLTLYLWLISKLDENFRCSFSKREALIGCNRDASKANYDWLDKSLDRLMFVNIKFFQREIQGRGKRIYKGSLLSWIKEDSSIESKNKMTVQLTPLSRILRHDKCSFVNIGTKASFVRQQVAQYLYNWFKCNNGVNGFHFKKDVMIHKLRRENEPDKAFVQRLKRTGLDPLVKLGILKDYEFEKDSIFLVWDKNFDNKKNKELDTKKAIKSKYGPKKPVKKVAKKKATKEDDEDFQGHDDWEV